MSAALSLTGLYPTSRKNAQNAVSSPSNWRPLAPRPKRETFRFRRATTITTKGESSRSLVREQHDKRRNRNEGKTLEKVEWDNYQTDATCHRLQPSEEKRQSMARDNTLSSLRTTALRRRRLKAMEQELDREMERHYPQQERPEREDCTTEIKETRVTRVSGSQRMQQHDPTSTCRSRMAVSPVVPNSPGNPSKQKQISYVDFIKTPSPKLKPPAKSKAVAVREMYGTSTRSSTGDSNLVSTTCRSPCHICTTIPSQAAAGVPGEVQIRRRTPLCTNAKSQASERETVQNFSTHALHPPQHAKYSAQITTDCMYDETASQSCRLSHETLEHLKTASASACSSSCNDGDGNDGENVYISNDLAEQVKRLEQRLNRICSSSKDISSQYAEDETLADTVDTPAHTSSQQETSETTICSYSYSSSSGCKPRPSLVLDTQTVDGMQILHQHPCHEPCLLDLLY